MNGWRPLYFFQGRNARSAGLKEHAHETVRLLLDLVPDLIK